MAKRQKTEAVGCEVEDMDASTWPSERSEDRRSKNTEACGGHIGRSGNTDARTRWPHDSSGRWRSDDNWNDRPSHDDRSGWRDSPYNSDRKDADDWKDRSSGSKDWKNKQVRLLKVKIVIGPTNTEVGETTVTNYQTFDIIKHAYIDIMKKNRDQDPEQCLTTSELWVFVAGNKKCHKDKVLNDNDILEGARVCIWPKNKWLITNF